MGLGMARSIFYLLYHSMASQTQSPQSTSLSDFALYPRRYIKISMRLYYPFLQFWLEPKTDYVHVVGHIKTFHRKSRFEG
jgi:hypothetical protein